MATRTLTLIEGQYDQEHIVENKWHWSVSHAVATKSATGHYNLIWKSESFAPKIALSWEVEYGFNYTLKIPAKGVKVTASGSNWHPCNKGEVCKINKLGFFESDSTSQPTDGWMSISDIQYRYQGVPGIHIIIGIKNASGDYDPIYVDPTELPPNSKAEYQPQEKIKWFFSSQDMTGQVFSRTESATQEKDVSSPSTKTNKFEWWTTYVFDSANWNVFDQQPKVK